MITTNLKYVFCKNRFSQSRSKHTNIYQKKNNEIFTQWESRNPISSETARNLKIHITTALRERKYQMLRKTMFEIACNVCEKKEHLIRSKQP